MKNQLFTADAPSLVAHHFRSKFSTEKKALVIAGYDYFLQKADLQRLLKKYQEVLLIPELPYSELNLAEKVMHFLKESETLHVVLPSNLWMNPEPLLRFIKHHHTQIAVTSIDDFCISQLQKVYVPAIPHTPYLEIDWLEQPPRWVGPVKRFSDIVTSLFLIMLSAPLWIISAVKIAAESPGRVFYTQKRLGKRNKEFVMVKFRSMFPNAEANGAVFSQKNDRRAFKYGKFMRITRIDELPQLINVLKGDLSLVGPRPERKVFVEQFREEMPHYDFRSVVKPGISGYAQIAYPYGIGAKDARHKLMYDLYYIKHWSIGLELSIMFRTIVTILSKQGR